MFITIVACFMHVIDNKKEMLISYKRAKAELSSYSIAKTTKMSYE